MKFLALAAVGFAGLALGAPQPATSSSLAAREPGLLDALPIVQDVTPVQTVHDILQGVQGRVADEVHTVVALVTPAKELVEQNGLVSDLVTDLHDIIITLVQATTSIVAIVLPTALALVGDVVALVGAVLSIVLSLVGDIVGTLVQLVDGLLDPVKALVIAELKAVLAVLGPVILPVLVFAKAVAGEVAEVVDDLDKILDLVNGALTPLGLPALDL